MAFATQTGDPYNDTYQLVSKLLTKYVIFRYFTLFSAISAQTIGTADLLQILLRH